MNKTSSTSPIKKKKIVSIFELKFLLVREYFEELSSSRLNESYFEENLKILIRNMKWTIWKFVFLINFLFF
jgi:hypothetical protein